MSERVGLSRVAAGIGGAAVALALVAAPGSAQAQGYGQGTTAPENTLLQAGRFEGGVNFAGIFVANESSPEGGATISQQTAYVNPGLYLGYMVTDQLQVRLLASYMHIYVGANGAVTQNSHSFLGAVQGLYHVPLPLGVALYGGAGVAGYGGGTTRSEVVIAPGSTTPSSVRIFNDTWGLGGQLLAGLLMQPGTNTNLRGGVRLDALFGRETPELAGRPAVGTQNYQFLLEFALSLR